MQAEKQDNLTQKYFLGFIKLKQKATFNKNQNSEDLYNQILNSYCKANTEEKFQYSEFWKCELWNFLRENIFWFQKHSS